MNELLSTYQPITLDEMSGIRLMNRIDTKFVTTLPHLYRLLEAARCDYLMQDIAGERSMLYRTTYFDTPDYDMFRTHITGRLSRQKLRFRTYVSSQLNFMEVKTKDNHGRTKKQRMRVTDQELRDADKLLFLNRHLSYDISSLRPTLSNSFERLTLVNRARTERLTIDRNLLFFNPTTGNTAEMNPLVIIELKRDGLQASPVLSLLRRLHIHPHGFSKYCMGMAFTDSTLRANTYRPNLREVEKLRMKS